MGSDSVAEMTLVDDAMVAPVRTWMMATMDHPGMFDGGVLNRDGGVVEAGIQVKARYRNQCTPVDPAEASKAPVQEGTHVYGGLLQNGHFGHFLVESLSRLWIAPLLCRIGSIAFIERTPGKGAPSFAIELLELLGIKAPLTVVSELTRFDALVVPSQILIKGPMMLSGAKPVQRLVEPLRSIRPKQYKKIYVSRSKLSPRNGGLLLERELEANLEAEGYFILHPQEYSIREQLSFYNGAEKLVFAEGSAAHLFALVARPEQRTFLVWRRRPRAAFREQLRSFGARSPYGRASVEGLWVPLLERGAINRSQAALNWHDLREQLSRAGFIGGNSWNCPSAMAMNQEMERIARLVKFAYEFRCI